MTTDNIDPEPIDIPKPVKPVLDINNHPAVVDVNWRIGQIEKLLSRSFSDNWRDRESYENRLKYFNDAKKVLIANLNKQYEEALKKWNQSLTQQG